jgi:hypothetical protein
MAEILLIFPPDKETAAGQIESALRSAGHAAILEPAVEPDGEAIARKAADHDAAVLIWSRPLAAAADLGGWPASLRRLPNLIEVSTDGIAPQSGDERRVVLLSGWRGQPFHLGWQRILDELESLGARRTAQSRPTAPPAAAPAAGPATGRPAVGAAAPSRRRRFAVPAGAALALLGAVGGAAWIGSNADNPPASSGPAHTADRPAIPSPAPKTVPEPAPASASLQSPLPARPEGAPPVPLPAPRAEPPPPLRIASAPSAEAVRPPPKRRSAAEPPVKRYSKKHSKTMRLFCARSGRSTPQCRIFARSTRAARS